jgi:hypothetical protein
VRAPHSYFALIECQPPRCSTPRTAMVAMEQDVEIAEIGLSEAPVAFALRKAPADEQRSYIRYVDGRFFEPAATPHFDRGFFPVNDPAAYMTRTAMLGTMPFKTMRDHFDDAFKARTTPIWPGKEKANLRAYELFDMRHLSKIDSLDAIRATAIDDGSVARWRDRADRVANNLLFIEGALHQRCFEPLYAVAPGSVSVSIGSLGAFSRFVDAENDRNDNGIDHWDVKSQGTKGRDDRVYFSAADFDGADARAALNVRSDVRDRREDGCIDIHPAPFFATDPYGLRLRRQARAAHLIADHVVSEALRRGFAEHLRDDGALVALSGETRRLGNAARDIVCPVSDTGCLEDALANFQAVASSCGATACFFVDPTIWTTMIADNADLLTNALDRAIDLPIHGT